MTVSKETAVKVSREIEKAIASILKENGLAAPKIKTAYGDIYRLTIETTVDATDENGINANSAEAVYYKRFGYTAYDAAHKGIELVAPLGTEFSVKGISYKFVGINSKRPKYSIAAMRISDGVVTGFADGVVPLINSSAS